MEFAGQEQGRLSLWSGQAARRVHAALRHRPLWRLSSALEPARLGCFLPTSQLSFAATKSAALLARYRVRRSASILECYSLSHIHTSTVSPAPSSTAVDPVCGMTVDVANARHTCEHGERSY